MGRVFPGTVLVGDTGVGVQVVQLALLAMGQAPVITHPLGRRAPRMTVGTLVVTVVPGLEDA